MPAAALIIRRRIKLAARLTRDFVTAWWDNPEHPEVRKKLLERFGTMTFPTAQLYYNMVDRTYPSTKDEFMILECVYRDRIPCPRIPGVVPRPLDWKGKTYRYYQDDLEPRKVYFFPDGFRLASSPAGPDASFLKFESEDGTIGAMSVTFLFYAVPEDTETKPRLEAARADLTKAIGQTPEMLSVQNAKGVATSLSLYVPNAEGRDSTIEKIPKAEVDLAKDIRGQITLTFKAFKAVWDAIFSKIEQQQIFTGWIDVKLEDGTIKEQVPVKLRLDRLAEQDYYKLLRPTTFTYKRKIAVNAKRAIFAAQAGGPDTVEAVEVRFADDENAAVDFDPSDFQDHQKSFVKKEVTVQRTVSSVLLGTTEPDGYNTYKYKVNVIRSRGPAKTKEMTSDATSLWILPEDLND